MPARLCTATKVRSFGRVSRSKAALLSSSFPPPLPQDLPSCMSVDEVRSAMHLDEVEAKRGMPVPCLGVTCKDRQASMIMMLG